MKTLFVCNAIHIRTKSFDFFTSEVLGQNPIVTTSIRYDDFQHSEYDLIVFWQTLPDYRYLDLFPIDKTILIPMYDDAIKTRFYQWIALREYRLISFSKALYNTIRKYCPNSVYVRYFPEFVESEARKPGTRVELFFWERESELNLDYLLSRLPAEIKVRIHFRSDVLTNRISQRKDVEIVEVPWFENRSSYLEYLRQVDFFVAPRKNEGIGLSFLEAMSIGKPVIAWDSSTMNEYVVDQVNGYLMNSKHGIPVLSINRNEINQTNRKLRDDWSASKKQLLEYISTPLSSVKRRVNLKELFHIGLSWIYHKLKFR